MLYECLGKIKKREKKVFLSLVSEKDKKKESSIGSG